VTQPLALLLYERLLPGSQLLQRLQDLGYRVVTAPGAEHLVESCRKEKPMVLVADIGDRPDRVCAALTMVRETPETSHIPVIAIIPPQSPKAEAAARQSGARLVVHDNVILAHLPQFLDQALALE